MIRVLSFLKPYRVPMAAAWGLMLVELAVELWQPLLMAKIIDEGIIKKDLSVVLQWGGLMVGISIAAFLAGIASSFVAAHASQGFGFDVRNSLFEKIQSFSFTNLSRFPASSLITRLTNDITQIQNTVFMSLRIMMRAPLLVVGGTIMAFLVNAKLAFILVVSLPFLLVFLLWLMNKVGKVFKSVQEKLDSVNRVIRENLSGMKLIKAFLRKNHEEKRFEKASKDLKEQTVLALRLVETTAPVLLAVMNVSILIVLWFGSLEVSSGNAKVGEVVAVINYAFRITSAFTIFTMIIMVFSRAKASGQRVAEVLETEVDLFDSIDAAQSTKVTNGKIEFSSVSFQYPGKEAKVLRDISFTAQPGETIAILGATGSGKSSLFQLIPRLYNVNEGAILIDDQDIRLIRLESLRKQIGFVPQEALLFSGTVRENIAWGKEDADFEEIIEAAKIAQIHETIESLPKKYETVIGQKGVNLSGGQKQRLSIARALVRKPKILLLDDSTSALDLKTETKLLHSLTDFTGTILIITQKISTAIEADKILLLEDGRLAAEGDHEFLLKNSSLYQNIYESQLGEGKYK